MENFQSQHLIFELLFVYNSKEILFFSLNLESILKIIFVKIYEHEYGPHTDGVYENRGHFTLDKFSGGETEFNVFAVNPFENYLKSMTLQDRRGNLFSDIMDNLATFHIFSIYNVPFKSVSSSFKGTRDEISNVNPFKILYVVM